MYHGKTVLITGTSKGVGNELAQHFTDNGADVVGFCRNIQDNDFSQIQTDLTDAISIESSFHALKTLCGKIDILVNNSAVLTSQYALKMSGDDALKMVLTNLWGAFMVTKDAVKMMNEGGRVINISSMAVALEPMGDSMYAACKAGLNKMSNIMAKEFAFMGITVNTLAISAIDTDMSRQLNKEKLDKVVAGLPIPRYATMDDITNVIDFFCSPKSSYITAQTIYLGGVHA